MNYIDCSTENIDIEYFIRKIPNIWYLVSFFSGMLYKWSLAILGFSADCTNNTIYNISRELLVCINIHPLIIKIGQGLFLHWGQWNTSGGTSPCKEKRRWKIKEYPAEPREEIFLIIKNITYKNYFFSFFSSLKYCFRQGNISSICTIFW